MKKRILTGMVIFLVTALFVASRLLTRFFFDAFVLGVSFMACYEMIKTYETDTRRCPKSYIYFALSYVPMTYMTYFLAGYFKVGMFGAIIYQMLLFAVYFMMSFVVEIVFLNTEASKAEENGIQPNELLLSTKRMLTLMLYPTTLLGTLYALNSFSPKLSVALIVTVFGVSMLTDVFANVFGVATHKGRFANQISPKKSMSGAIFGIVGGILFACIMLVLVKFTGVFGDAFKAIAQRDIIVFFVFAGVLGSFITEFGDLVSSAVKRNSGIKDFGKIFPGHGGMMDRVDGLMFTSAIVYILAMILFL